MMQLIKITLALVFLGIIFSILQTARPKVVNTLHTSLNSTQDFFENAYKNVDSNYLKETVYGITVNHHLLAVNHIAQQFSLISSEEEKNVVLISPNHFSAGKEKAITSTWDWQTPYGVLKSNTDMIEKLKKAGVISIEPNPFINEHGVSGLVGFVKKSLPNARFIPIIIKDNMSDSESEKLALTLYELIPEDTVLVGSIDFSHYLTNELAQFHDKAAISIIERFDYHRIPKMDLDTAPGLRTLLKYMELKEAQKFVLVSNENSATITGKLDFLETTSYINGYFVNGSPSSNTATTATLIVTGIPESLENPDLWDVLHPHYAYKTSDRLFLGNDYLYTNFVPTNPNTSKALTNLGFKNIQQLPLEYKQIFENINFEGVFVAVGVLSNSVDTEVYIFPLEWNGTNVSLLSGKKAVIILEQIARRSDNPELASQILKGKINIK